jgi:tetratricopeptide (TPR) repeat protein
LEYWGQKANVEEISAKVYDHRRRGTLSTQLAPLARSLGFNATYVEGSIGRLKGAIDRGVPPIVMVKIKEDLYHFFVASGYSDSEKMVMCEEYNHVKRLISYDEFESLWSPTAYFMLEVTQATAESDFSRAADLEGRGEYKEALALYERAVSKDPRHQPSYVGIGNCRLALGDKPGSIEAYRKGLDLYPEDPRAGNNLAHVLCEEGRDLREARALVEGAVESYQTRLTFLKDSTFFARDEASRRDLEFQGSSVELELAMALGTLGQVRCLQGDHALAVAAWKASYDLLPMNLGDLRAKRLLQIAGAFRGMGMASQEKTYLEQARAAASDSSLIRKIEDQLQKVGESTAGSR